MLLARAGRCAAPPGTSFATVGYIRTDSTSDGAALLVADLVVYLRRPLAVGQSWALRQVDFVVGTGWLQRRPAAHVFGYRRDHQDGLDVGRDRPDGRRLGRVRRLLAVGKSWALLRLVTP